MVFWLWSLPRVEENLSNRKGCLPPVQSGMGLVLRQKGDPRVQMNLDASRVLVSSHWGGSHVGGDGAWQIKVSKKKSLLQDLSVPIGHFQDQFPIFFISQVFKMPPFLCILHLSQGDLPETPV